MFYYGLLIDKNLGNCNYPISQTMSKKKPMIEYLEIDENIYIENDVVKTRFMEYNGKDFGTWDDMWQGVLKIIQKAREYDEEKKNRND